MFPMKSLLATTALIPLAISQVEACGSTTTDDRDVVTDGGTWQVSYVPDPDPIPMGSRFALDVSVASAADPTDLDEATSIKVDAWMPEHGHGMSTVPKVTPNGDGTFYVENMTFQMDGYWEILVDVTRGTVKERATFEVDCCQ